MTKKELEKLGRKLERIRKKDFFWFTGDFTDHEAINRKIVYYLRAEKLVIKPTERDYITAQHLPFTFDWEDRREMILKN